MMTPRRRSARLQKNTPAKAAASPAPQLSAVDERDESPQVAAPAAAATPSASLMSSPHAPRTPATAGRIKAAHDEMHPSHAHRSTTRKPDSGLRLGFIDIEPGKDQPSGLTQTTPSKSTVSQAAFDFRFARPMPDLGPDAQRLREELREQALEIKAKLAAEREEKLRNGEGDPLQSLSGRKIAQPTSKVGRFSDVHMAAFKKMDSIAAHPSSFRAQPGRSTPNKASLKRSPSKATLDEGRETKKRKSDAHAAMPSSEPDVPVPAKRTRTRVEDDGSSKRQPAPEMPAMQNFSRPTSRVPASKIPTTGGRPVSREGAGGPPRVPEQPSTPSVVRTRSDFLSHITTPTQSSLARSESTQKLTSQARRLPRSTSKSGLSVPKSATTNNLATSGKSSSNLGLLLKSPSAKIDLSAVIKSPTATDLAEIVKSPSTRSMIPSPAKLDQVKSILRKPFQSASKLDASSSNIPNPVQISPVRFNIDKELPPAPGTPSASSARVVKHVSFTPVKLSTEEVEVVHSPSPIKSAAPRRNVVSKKDEVEYPDIGEKASKVSDEPTYFSLQTGRAIATPKRRLASTTSPPPSVPANFTFRSDNTIEFGALPEGFGPSTGQASVRQVRDSMAPQVMPGTYPPGDADVAAFPTVPHGMPNKKRRRSISDEEEKENGSMLTRTPKKQKPVATGSVTALPAKMAPPSTPRSHTLPPKSKSATPAKGKRFLSLNRLNMLSKPKLRK